ncbi:DUF3080 family protein [Shewanella sp. GXUN23E]|uniref:DUF3080 family protein n=1 Tax=Shewanella sp. GXUN23E TaxID=3422498 RepID=UPI003D7DEF96
MNNPWWRWGAVLWLCLSVSGCNRKNADDLWQDYLSRLETVLQQDTQLNDVNTIQFHPAKLPAPRFTENVGLLDIIKLDRCHLGSVVSAHNSGLGRVAPPSQLFAYHVSYMQLAPECITQLATAYPKLADVLTQSLQSKRATALQMFRFMLTNDESLRASLFAGEQSLSLPSATAGLTETGAALAVLRGIQQDLLTGSYSDITLNELEPALEMLHHQHILRGYLAGARDSLNYLRRVNHLLAQAVGSNHCINGRNNQQQMILATVFRKYFLPGPQAYLSKLRQIQLSLGPSLRALYQDTPYQSLVDYYFDDTALDGLYLDMRQEIQRHVAWWQALQDSCQGILTP